MRTQVIFASLLMLTVSLAGCITDSAVEQTTDDTVEQTTDEITEVLGCMDESALNYNVNATNSSGLCLSEAQLLLAEDVFWSSWDADAINNATGPVGYRLMIGETSADDNESACLEIQEVFSPDYYDQEIVGAFESDNISAGTCEERAEQIFRVQNDTAEGRGGTVKFFNDAKGFGFKNSQTVFDNVVQVEKFSDGEWDNYSMDTASTYDEFRNRLEHGPGIRDDSSDKYEAVEETETVARSEDGGPGDCNDGHVGNKPCGFPSVADTEFESIDFHEVELRGSGHAQTIYYFAKDASTGTEIEVMGEMTEDGFKITEYCNEIPSTNYSIIDSYMGIRADDTLAGLSQRSFVISARIILLETDGNELRFEEYDYVEPVNSRSENGTNTEVLGGVRAIPFYFDWIPDSDANETENKSATEEGRKGLNAVNVKVVIAGPSGPYGMEGDLSDYHLVTSNCTFDNATTGEDYTTEADNMTRDDEEETSGRSENATRDAVSALPTGKRVYGSDGNTCTNIDVYDLSDIDGLLEHGIVFVDADSSGTLSEGDRFEFSDNFTCDDCAEANMLRLFSISADEFSDGNINPSSKMSVVHEGAMNAIRNIRAVTPDDPAPPVNDCGCHNSRRSNRDT